MARDVGAEMLQVLDDALAAGEIRRSTYDAKRAEVVALIQRGEAIELEPLDIALVTVLKVAAAAWFVWLIIATDAHLFGLIGAIVGSVVCILMARRIARRGWSKRH